MNTITYSVLGKKTFLFFFLYTLVVPVFSVNRLADGIAICNRGAHIIWEIPVPLVGREWLLMNQVTASSHPSNGMTGDMLGDPAFYRLQRKLNGEYAWMLRGIMSKNAGSNMVGAPKPPREVASFQCADGGDASSVCLDITAWAINAGKKLQGKLLPETLETVAHCDGVEWIGWYKLRNGYVQVSSCLRLLDETLMPLRKEDLRVGYFRSKHAVIGDTAAYEDDYYCISRWRLEPRPEDVKKYCRGKLVEPKQPIEFYIDPLTPTRWVPYIRSAIEVWNEALEQAGFKNAIRTKTAEEAPADWTLASCRAAIVYRPSTDENAFGERYADPRSGQIYHARIMWGHSLVEWLKGNYLIQAGPSDESVFTQGISDEWLGTMIGMIVSHEVGHVLGLTHNMAGSAVIPVDKLRDNDWLAQSGISVSLMDYARFNYVAQPGDGIERVNLLPRVGKYDRWAIEWGYRLFPKIKDAAKEQTYLSSWIAEEQEKWGQWYGAQNNTADPRCQAEDMGDDLVVANTYGMRNLQWVLQRMDSLPADSDGSYSTYQSLYNRILKLGERNVPAGQYFFYLKQIINIVGGKYMNYDARMQLQEMPVAYMYQQRAMEFLSKYLFATPDWLLKPMEAGKIEGDPHRFWPLVQRAGLALLLPKASIMPVDGEKSVYTQQDFFEALNVAVWNPVLAGKLPDEYTRALHREFFQQVRMFVSRGGPEAGKLYCNYLIALKSKIEQVRRDKSEETFGLYCERLVEEINKFLK